MNFKEPAVTVIIPTYKRPRLLRRAINSVLDQTYQDFQICVYDNASGDETREIMKVLMQKDARIKYFCHAENIGVVKNCIFALERVNTPFFSFLCDDDILLPNFLETTLSAFNRYPTAMLSAGLCLIVQDREIKAISPPGSREGYLAPPDSLLEIIRHHLTWTSVLIRREVIQTEVGTFDEEADYATDIDYLFRIAAHHPIVLTRTPSAIYVMNPSSYSVQWSPKPNPVLISGFSKVINNLIADEGLSPEVKSEVKQHLGKYLKGVIYSEGTKAVKCRDFDYANETASLLRHQFGDELRSKMILALANTNRYSPPLYYSIIRLYSVISRFKSSFKSQDERALQADYQNYIQVLDSF
ncbi:MAG: glycosyltransferase family 2 protein [Halobacteriota archaeon]|jgi:glycosyltransferase involved in cell wall biosynthesis